MKMKKPYVVLVFALIVAVGSLSLAHAGFCLPKMDRDDQTSQPNGYAEAIVMGSWNSYINPYYSVQHTAMTHPSNLSGTVTVQGWSKNVTLIYSVTLGFSGTVTYNPPYHNVIWAAETLVTVSGETADAWIGPPGSQ